MADFFTGKALDEKLTDIIWKANKELIILSPFIRLDEYCKKIFSKLKNSPELEMILVFGKNEGETQRSLNQDDLEFFKGFENILLNPITARRIELVCGSVEAFLADPSKFRDKFPDPNYEWMCAVSAEEAKISLERMLSWANSNESLKGGSLGEWIFNRETFQTASVIEPNYIMSKTPNAAQRIIFLNDKPNEFPSTPQTFESNPLQAYYDGLKEGATFFRNHNGEYIVVKRRFSNDNQSLLVMTKSAYVWREGGNGEHVPMPVIELEEKISDKDLPHSLTEITYENGLFVHEKIETGFHPLEELEEIFLNYTQE